MAAKEHKSLQGSKILLIEDDKSIMLTGSMDNLYRNE